MAEMGLQYYASLMTLQRERGLPIELASSLSAGFNEKDSCNKNEKILQQKFSV